MLSSSALSESGNMDPIVVNLLEEREEVIVPVQKNSTKLITGFMSKLSPEAAKEERSRTAAETVSQNCTLSSKSVERAFSMLKYIYTDQQSHSMVDLIKTTLMLRYNKD